MVQDFVNRQAEWSEEMRDYEAAADMYLQVRGTHYGIAAAMTGVEQHLICGNFPAGDLCRQQHTCNYRWGGRGHPICHWMS